MSLQFPEFNGIQSFGSLQDLSLLTTETTTVPQILLVTGSPLTTIDGTNATGIVLSDLYTASFPPLTAGFGSYVNNSSSGLVINRVWAPSQPLSALTLTAAATATTYSLSLTAVGASIGQAWNGYAVYVGTITGGASNAFVGYTFTITGFTNGVNNGTWICIASTATTLTLANSAAVVETHAATAASGTTVYTGTITGGASNSYAGCNILIAGFSTGANNGAFLCVASDGTTLTLLNSAGVAETHSGTATIDSNMNYSGQTINVVVSPIGNPNLDDSAYVAGLTVNMSTANQTTISGSSSAVGVTAIETENSVSLPSGNTSTVQIHQVIGLYTESLIGNFSNPDGVYNLDDHWNYHCAGMGWVGHATGTIGISAGIFMEGPRVPTGCVITTRAGLYMQVQDQNTGGSITNAYGIYEVSTTEKNNLGSVYVGSHLGLQAANSDFAGTITVSSSTTATKTFSVNYTGTAAPIVVLTPTSSPATAANYWITYTGSTGAWTGFTVNITNSTTITFNYVVIGNPN